MVWYSHLLHNFPQFIVIYTVKGFGIINKAEIDVFLELFCFFDDPVDIGNLISGSLAFSKTSLNIYSPLKKKEILQYTTVMKLVDILREISQYIRTNTT